MLYRITILILAISLLNTVQATVDSPAVREQLRSYVDTLSTQRKLGIQQTFIASEIVLPALYHQRQYAPVWQNIRAIHQLLEVLERVHEDGLDANDYHVSELKALQDELWRSDEENSRLQAEYDLLLTDSLIRLGYHLLVGKVDPVELDSQWNMESTIGSLEMVLNLAEAIDIADIPALVERLRPDSTIYRDLKAALAKYRGIAEQGGWEAIPGGPTIRPGMSDPRVVLIRKRLLSSGDYKGAPTPSISYDAELIEAVSRFQYRHGMEMDGLIGRKTVNLMNIPVQDKINKLKINLERARWVLHDLPDEYVLTDIAGFTVSYYRYGKRIWQTRAQVGQPFRKTPVFRSNIRYLVMNPTWTVPETILEEDVLPKVHKDPDYLAKKRLHVLDFNGNPVDQSQIDWTLYPDKKFPYMLRQEAGPGGALGRIKFMFPNKHSVYLHDTPYRSLFNNNERAFSSGCIRIEKPYELAELLLQNPQQWSRTQILESIDSLASQHVSLPKPIAVILFYWTAGIDENGKVLFKRDIYDRDAAIAAGLSSRFRFRKQPILDNDIQTHKMPRKLLSHINGH